MESSSTTPVVDKARNLGGFSEQDMAVGAKTLSGLNPSEVVKKYQINSQDTGSPEVQVALLTRRLEILTKHFATNPKDHHSRRGMMNIISQRKQLLAYLRRESVERYRNTLSALGLRK
jgi:small subunit ribosomal protein S15